jgi:hypothetical protein
MFLPYNGGVTRSIRGWAIFLERGIFFGLFSRSGKKKSFAPVKKSQQPK